MPLDSHVSTVISDCFAYPSQWHRNRDEAYCSVHPVFLMVMHQHSELFVTGGPNSRCKELFIEFSFNLYANVQQKKCDILRRASTIMYQSNRSLNISPAYPGNLTTFPAQEGGNLMNLVFPGAGHLITTHRGGEFDH